MEKEMLHILENSSMGEKETKAVYNELLNLFSVSKCHDSGHNTYIDYDGECGACGGKEKE